MDNQTKPKNLAEALPVAIKLFQKYNTPEAQKKWKGDMYAHRWRYFITVHFYILVCIFFLWLGENFKTGFYSPIHWYIWMGLSSIFLLIGIWVWWSYLKLILRG